MSSRTEGSRAPGAASSTSASSSVTIVPALSCGMENASNAIVPPRVTQGTAWRAATWGLVGVLGFSFSLPMTRLAVEDLDPTFVGLGRALVAAALAAALLLAPRERGPDARAPPRFAIVGLGGGV